MNIVLIGYRGTGKSTVGKLLARRLGRDLLSTDTEVVKRAKLSIPELVERHGWDYFRDMESTVCRDLAGRDQVIIDTGGGAILRLLLFSYCGISVLSLYLSDPGK